MRASLDRRVGAEFLGTMFLVAAVIGSGIMGSRLAGGNIGLALLANTIATGAALVALILTFGPISGAHLNPVITFMDALEKGLPWIEVPYYVLAQIAGGITGAIIANWMFGLTTITLATHIRSGTAQLFSEFVATFGLVCVVWGASRFRADSVPIAVGSYITAAYWFTASTSFANPAVTISRCMSNTFAGIRPKDVVPFVIAQLLGGLAATLLFRWLAPGLSTQAKQLLVAHEPDRELIASIDQRVY